MQEEENLKTSLPMGFVQLHQPSKQNYQAPLLEIYSYLAESGYAASVTPDPEGLGNGYYGGSSSKADNNEPYNPWSDPTETLYTIDF